jgi:hypothetical protein
LAGCEFAANAFILEADCNTYFGCEFAYGATPLTLGSSVFGAPNSTSWSGWGLNATSTVTLRSGQMTGFWVSVVTSGSAFVQIGGTCIWLGGEMETNQTAAVYASSFGNVASLALMVFLVEQDIASFAPVCIMRNTNAGNGVALQVTGGTAGEATITAKFHRCTFTAQGTGTAVQLSGNVQCTFGSTVTGTGGTNGVVAASGAKLYFNGAFGITGAAGADASVDNGTSFVAAAFFAAAQDSANMPNGTTIVRTS